MLDALKGHKTYLVALALAAAALAHSLGYLSDDAYKTTVELLGPTGLITLAAKVNRVQKQTE